MKLTICHLSHYRRLINTAKLVAEVASRCPWKSENFLSLIGQSNETVKRTEGLILIEGYAAGNNRQLAACQSTMRLGFADNGLRGTGSRIRGGRARLLRSLV